MPCQGCRCLLEGLSEIGDFHQEFYHAGVMLFEQGDPVHAGFIICEGAVQLEGRTTEGSRVILQFLGSANSLVEEVLTGLAKHQTTARTLRDSRIMRLTRAPLLQIIAQFPQLSQRVALELARRQSFLLRRLLTALDVDLGVRERLISALLELNDTFGVSTPEGRLIDLDLSSQQWADYIGCRRQTLSQAFNDLEERGWLERHSKRVLLKDVEVLKEFVKPYV